MENGVVGTGDGEGTVTGAGLQGAWISTGAVGTVWFNGVGVGDGEDIFPGIGAGSCTGTRYGWFHGAGGGTGIDEGIHREGAGAGTGAWFGWFHEAGVGFQRTEGDDDKAEGLGASDRAAFDWSFLLCRKLKVKWYFPCWTIK